MVRFDAAQRSTLSRILGELANLSAAALVLGQFLRPQPLSWEGLVVGTLIWGTFVSGAIVLAREKDL